MKVGFAPLEFSVFWKNRQELLLSYAVGKAKPKSGKLFSSCPHQSVLFSQAVKTFRGINALSRAFIPRCLDIHILSDPLVWLRSARFSLVACSNKNSVLPDKVAFLHKTNANRNTLWPTFYLVSPLLTHTLPTLILVTGSRITPPAPSPTALPSSLSP